MTKEKQLKNLLQSLTNIQHRVVELIFDIREQLGPAVDFIEDVEDVYRVKEDEPLSMDGSYFGESILQTCWELTADYNWYYNGAVFRIYPLKDNYAFKVFFPDGTNTIVNFKDVVGDCIDYKEDLWTFMEARIVGLADGYISAKKETLNHVIGEVPTDESAEPVVDDTFCTTGRGQYSHKVEEEPEKAITYYGG